MENKQKTAAELRAEVNSENGGAREIISNLFDDSTFVELGTYVRRLRTELDTDPNCEYEGVITGYGAVDGHLVYAFVQDFSRMKGALSEAHAKKIVALYNTALNNNAPVIGFFDSAGANILEGISALSGYGMIMKKVSETSGVIPQIAVISGICSGASAIIAGMFDFTIGVINKGSLYINPPFILKEKFGNKYTGKIWEAANNGAVDILTPEISSAIDDIKKLLKYLPANNNIGTNIDEATDDINRLTPELENINEMKAVITTIADQGEFFEISGPFAQEIITGFMKLNGSVIGVVANNGAISAKAALKAAKFIGFCDGFKIPLLTLVDTEGYDISLDSEHTPFSTALSGLAYSYAMSDNAKVTVILGKAYGSAFTLMGSKTLGADIVFAIDRTSICIMPPESYVSFVWRGENKEISQDFINNLVSPLNAARNGDIDDIISCGEIRQRITAAFEMLAFKNGG